MFGSWRIVFTRDATMKVVVFVLVLLLAMGDSLALASGGDPEEGDVGGADTGEEVPIIVVAVAVLVVGAVVLWILTRSSGEEEKEEEQGSEHSRATITRLAASHGVAPIPKAAAEEKVCSKALATLIAGVGRETADEAGEQTIGLLLSK
jgi:hypothetical protein